MIMNLDRKSLLLVGAIFLVLGILSGVTTGFDWLERFLVCLGISLLTLFVCRKPARIV